MPLLTVPEFYRRTFSNHFEQAVQQETQKLGTKIRLDTFSGKQKVYNDIEEADFEQRGRLQNSAPKEITGYKRVNTKVPFVSQRIFDQDDDDFLADLGRPDGETIESMRMAWARLVDTKVAAGATATVYGGAEPYVTAINLPNTQEVAVNYVPPGDTPANSGLTPWKLLEAIRILEENDIDTTMEDVCIAINPKAKNDLITYVAESPNDVWAAMIKLWLEGKDEKLMGLKPVLTNRLETDASTDIDTIPVWSRRRGIYGCVDGLRVEMDILPEKQHALQISAYGKIGIMRRFEEAVVAIYADRSP